MQGLADFNKAHPDLANDRCKLVYSSLRYISLITYSNVHQGQEFLDGALAQSLTESEYEALQAERWSLVKTHGVKYVLDKYNLDVVVVPAFTELAGYNAISGT